MKRIILTLLLFISVIGNVLADDVTFVASAPKSVVLGQRFRLTYTVNTTDAKEPIIADMPDFDILSGPNISTQQSYSSVNGKTTSSVSVTFTYILLPKSEGEFTIQPAKINAEGKEITSNSLSIKVLPEDRASSAVQNGDSRQHSNTSANISNDDLFMRATLSKTKVYEQEAVLLTYKVYSAVNLTNLSFPTPELKGFNIQEVELPQEKQFELEHYNGRNYNTIVWRQFVLFPQQSGKLEIPSLDFEAVVAVQNRRSVDPFEMMFSGFSGYVEVKKVLKTTPLSLEVEKLPFGKPADYSGGVGEFTIGSTINNTKLKTNSEFTLKVIVKGTGNMRLLGNPQFELPTEFESYDPVIENNFRLTANGFKGEKVYEYLITPKASGTYTIPSAHLSFFNTSTGSYETLKTQEYTVEVEKGSEATVTLIDNTQINKEKGKVLASDIRHIKYGDEGKAEKSIFFGSSRYMLSYAISLLLVLLFLVIYRKKVAENANTSLVRTKKANKVATRRLKVAKTLMKENKVNEFYDEILKAMWGYTSDKLSIPMSQLSKENIASTLLSRGVSDELVTEFQEILSEGEFARYAPGDKEAAMERLYTMSINVISKMENSIKNGSAR
ncbi:MAG: protein BatD [Bacteroidaceae bacterium]|nr:protein BatD [Bacteroidaceae bacterium]